MIIPYEYTFQCALNPSDTLDLNIAEKTRVTFGMGAYAVMMKDREEITMVRDMLTAWLSRKDRKL